MSKRLFDDVEKTATISPCGRYRHALGRYWNREAGFVLFIGLNPSTADAEQDDPTIRRCVRFARDWGYGGIEMGNLFDWRATDPKDCRRAMAFAVSDKNDACLRVRAAESRFVIAAWGAAAWAQDRISQVFRGVFNEERRWHCLGLTKGGSPRHPLYVPAVTKPILFW